MGRHQIGQFRSAGAGSRPRRTRDPGMGPRDRRRVPELHARRLSRLVHHPIDRARFRQTERSDQDETPRIRRHPRFGCRRQLHRHLRPEAPRVHGVCQQVGRETGDTPRDGAADDRSVHHGSRTAWREILPRQSFGRAIPRRRQCRVLGDAGPARRCARDGRRIRTAARRGPEVAGRGGQRVGSAVVLGSARRLRRLPQLRPLPARRVALGRTAGQPARTRRGRGQRR